MDEPGNPAEGGGSNAPVPPNFTTFKDAVKTVMSGDSPTPPGQPDPAQPPTPPPGQPTPPAGQPDPNNPPAAPDEPVNFSQAKADHWNKLKGDRDTWKQKASELEKQHAEAAERLKRWGDTNPDELNKKVEAIAKERDEMLARIERTNIELSPRFQQAFNSRFERITKQITDTAGKDGELALAIAKAPPGEWKDSTLEKLLDGIESKSKQLRLVALLNEFDTVTSERNTVLENSRTEHAKMVEQEKAEAAERQRQQQLKREARVTEAMKAAAKYDTFKDEIQAGQLKKILSGDPSVDYNTFADTVMKGLDHARINTVLQAVTKERDELKRTIEAMTKGNPGLRGGNQPNNPAGDQPMTFKEKVKQVMSGGV